MLMLIEIKNSLKSLTLIFSSFLIPSVFLPVPISSSLLVILLLLDLTKLIYEPIKVNKHFMKPFVFLFSCTVVGFIIDTSHGVNGLGFLIKNAAVIIIPFHFIVSNFTQDELNRVINLTLRWIILLVSLIILVWLLSRFENARSAELLKESWHKEQIDVVKDGTSETMIVVKAKDSMASLRRVVKLESQFEEITRKITVAKPIDNKTNAWILIRQSDGFTHKGAWFSLKDGTTGEVQKGIKAKTIINQDSTITFQLSNTPKNGSIREWYHLSIVDKNKSYRWRSHEDLNIKVSSVSFSSNKKNLLEDKFISSLPLKASPFDSYGHSTYFSLVIIFAILLILRKTVVSTKEYFSIALLVTSIALFASKAAIASLFILSILICVFQLKHRMKGVFIILFFFTLISIIPTTNNRLSDFFNTLIGENYKDIEYADLSDMSTSNRIKIYDYFISQNIDKMIVGFGNERGEKHFPTINDTKFNAHNQVLQTLYNSGILGIIFLTYFFKFAFKEIRLNKQPYGFIFLILFCFNMLFESLLYRQWGIIILVFSVSYFQYDKFLKKENGINHYSNI